MDYSTALLLILAVGCDGIIGSSAQRDACGVCSGDSNSCQRIKLDLSDQFQLGHNKIASIPKGACNITLTERKPTGNVFALRVARGYFLNGQWTASNIGDYPAAGTLFHYQHVTNGNSVRLHGEKITAPGPLTEDVDIILITKKANRGITLEYSISGQRSPNWNTGSNAQRPSSSSSSSNNSNQRRRHRADSQQHPNEIPHIDTSSHRGDIPSIAEDFVDTPIRVENVPTPPAPRERYVWSVAGYTACSRTCGKGIRQSNIVCMMERSRRMVDDAYCQHIIKPAVFQEQCQLEPCPSQWQYGEWGACSVSCGAGTQTREARCMQTQGDGQLADVSEDNCGAQHTQGMVRTCHLQPCHTYAWRSGEWSPCDAACGTGSQRRLVKCYDDGGEEVADEHCRNTRKPEEAQACAGGNCRGTWLMDEWDSKCSNGCGTGQTTRNVICWKDGRQQDARMCDAYSRPATQQACTSQVDCGGRWYEGPWSECSPTCGLGTQSRDVICLSSTSSSRDQCEVLPESQCKYHPKPESQRQCQGPQCHEGEWYHADWTPCSHSCGVGVRQRQVECLNKDQQPTGDCPQNDKPDALESCGNDICPSDNHYYAAQESADASFVARPPVDLNNKAGTLYDAQPENDYRRPVDLNNKAGTLYDAQPQQDYRRPIDLNNKAGTLYDAQPQQDYRPPIDLNNKAGTLYDAQPQQDYRRPVDLNNKAGTLYDAQPQADYRPPIDLNNKAGTLYDAQPQQDYRRPIDLNNKAGTLYDAQPQQDYRPPVDLNNKAGTLYDAQPQQDYRPPIDLNNKAGTLYDAQPQQDYRPPVDLNNKAGTLFDAQPQQDYRPPPVDLNNKGPSYYYDPPREVTTLAPHYLAYQAGPERSNRYSNRTLSRPGVDIELPQHGIHVLPEESRHRPTRPRNGHKRSTRKKATSGECVDKIDRCKSVMELAFCRYDYYKKMCCKSCS